MIASDFLVKVCVSNKRRKVCKFNIPLNLTYSVYPFFV